MNQNKLIECVPNFSEGRDLNIINAITQEIVNTDGVKLLDVDPGRATNRAVVTFVGEPEAVIEAAFKAIVKAGTLIDMTKHKGEHSRMGATDVCPLIPVANITMEETAQYAVQLAERVGNATRIPVYLYGAAQKDTSRNDLSVIREGEYEGFFEKIKNPKWKPDFGPSIFNPKSGATVIGARDFLIAYNVNLNTTSTRIANRIAFDVREAGRVKRIGNPYIGEIEKDKNGEAIRIPGSCKAVKAVGWYIEEYGIAQISANLMDYNITPIQVFFDEVVKSAFERGVRVTGSELVGLIPLQAMLDAGKYFLQKQERSIGVSDEELIKIAVKSLGLDELQPFDPRKKIIEFQLEDSQTSPLIHMLVKDLINETASESMAPGGGSISSLVGALGVSLGSMVANLSANKPGWEDKLQEFSAIAEKAQMLKNKLTQLIDEDTKAFNAIISAIRMPKETKNEQMVRKDEIEKASQYATEVPFQVMSTAYEAIEIVEIMTQKGNKSSISDVGVGAMCLKTAIKGAFMNVLINAKDLNDESFAQDISKRGEALWNEALPRLDHIISNIFNPLLQQNFKK